MRTASAEGLLRIVLVLAGTIMAMALVAMVMPRAWMAGAHEWLGLGDFPDKPIVTYLARTTSGLYGLLGVLLLLCASDTRRYRALTTMLVVGIAALAAVGLVFGLADGMPLWWPLMDAASAGGLAGAVLFLQSVLRRQHVGA